MGNLIFRALLDFLFKPVAGVLAMPFILILIFPYALFKSIRCSEPWICNLKSYYKKFTSDWIKLSFFQDPEK